MRIIAGIALCAVFFTMLVVLPPSAPAEDSEYAVIANKQMAGSAINKAALKGIYLREVKNWGNGNQIVVVDLEGSGDFYENLFGKTYVQMQAYWLNMRIKYSVDLPVSKKDSSSVKQFVASTKGSIGFIPKSDVDDSIKVLTIK